MNRRMGLTAIAAALAGWSTLASAQPGHRGNEQGKDHRGDGRGHDRGQGRGPDMDRRDRGPDRDRGHDRGREWSQRDRDRGWDRDRGHPRYYYNARGPEFHRGRPMPYEYRAPYYRVRDWRAYRLPPPPAGTVWVQIGPDFVLMALATGLIVNIVLSAY